MRLNGQDGLGQLTYCTNIHAGEAWDDVLTSLRTHVPPIKQTLAPDADFGIGLRLGGSAAEALKHPSARAELASFLDDGGYTIFTLNGFPYGAFHGQKVKEEVYKPDWSEPVRLAYTNDLADTLAEFLPDGQFGSISTVPGTFKPWAAGRTEAIVRHLVSHIAHLIALKSRTGKVIALALEPEPYCMLETIEETATFFKEHLFAAHAVDQLTKETGLSQSDAEAALRTHIGVCYDVCHAAVEYEDPRGSVDRLRAEGIAIPKLQLSSALRVARVDADAIAALRGFDEPVYLHQVIQKDANGIFRFKDLPDAFAKSAEAMESEWRIHFHVPIFLEELETFGTTQAFLREILALHRADPISPHLEVETYTWDVLPAQYRNVSVSDAIAREMVWVRDQLLS